MKYKLLTLIFFIMVNHLNAQSSKKALLVIDVQENLLNPHSKMHMDTSKIDNFCIQANQMIQYYHQNGWPVLYVVNEWTNPFLNFITGNVVKKGGKGTGIDARIEIVNDRLYRKSVGNALSNKELAEFLCVNQISELTLIGLFAENCIKETLRAALKKGYRTTVAEDAVGSRNARCHRQSIEYFKKRGAFVLKSTDIQAICN
jgi:nicotinamidase-related amidase